MLPSFHDDAADADASFISSYLMLTPMPSPSAELPPLMLRFTLMPCCRHYALFQF